MNKNGSWQAFFQHDVNFEEFSLSTPCAIGFNGRIPTGFIFGARFRYYIFFCFHSCCANVLKHLRHYAWLAINLSPLMFTSS